MQQGTIWESLRRQNAVQGSFGKFFCEPDGDGLLDEGFNGSSGDTLLLLRQDKYRIFHKIASMEIYKMSLIDINK